MMDSDQATSRLVSVCRGNMRMKPLWAGIAITKGVGHGLETPSAVEGNFQSWERQGKLEDARTQGMGDRSEPVCPIQWVCLGLSMIESALCPRPLPDYI